MPRWENTLSVLSSLAMLGASAVVLVPYLAHRPSTWSLPKKPLRLSDAIKEEVGSPAVGMLLFTDYQCPFCKRLWTEVLPAIRARYVKTGRALLAIRQLPLPIHPFARRAAVSSRCAAEQSAFDQADRFFFSQQRIDASVVEKMQTVVPLKADDFDRCVQTSGNAQVDRDLEEARTLGIASTPFMIVGDINATGELVPRDYVRGAPAVAEFDRVLEVALAPRRAGAFLGGQ